MDAGADVGHEQKFRNLARGVNFQWHDEARKPDPLTLECRVNREAHLLLGAWPTLPEQVVVDRRWGRRRTTVP